MPDTGQYAGWCVADEGIVDSVEYVTVLDAGLNPDYRIED